MTKNTFNFTWFRFEAKRVIVRQGHPASAFYFILSGSVVVMVTEGELQVAKPMAYLARGTTFGVSGMGAFEAWVSAWVGWTLERG